MKLILWYKVEDPAILAEVEVPYSYYLLIEKVSDFFEVTADSVCNSIWNQVRNDSD